MYIPGEFGTEQEFFLYITTMTCRMRRSMMKQKTRRGKRLQKHYGVLVANWEVGHTQCETSQLPHVRFQPEKVRLVGLGFKMINPVVLWITPSGCRVM